MSAKAIGAYDYDPDAPLSCPDCGWAGTGDGHESYHRELLDVCCPGCERMLLIVPYPTAEETRAAARAGNERARAELPNVEAREARLRRAGRAELKRPDQLPDLSQEGPLLIEWDIEERDDETWTVLRHNGRQIWRELAYWEGYERFATVFGILRERYGRRLAEVRPTSASELYLYGDILTAPATVDALNESLKAP